MCKEGWCVGLGQEGDCMREGGELPETSVKGWNRKERRNKDLKKTESRGGCLSKGRAGISLCTNNSFFYSWL